MKTSEMKFVFMDRFDRADDNAEFMYKWTVKHHPEIKCTFLINESCED